MSDHGTARLKLNCDRLMPRTAGSGDIRIKDPPPLDCGRHRFHIIHTSHKILQTLFTNVMQFTLEGKMIKEKLGAIAKMVLGSFIACQRCYTPVAPGEPCWNCGTMN
jgi:hypothetical protein